MAGEEVVIAEPTFWFTNADEQQIEHTSIGPLEIGMSLSEIKFILKEKPLISKRLRNNDYGTYEQSLTFRKTGLKITTAQPSLENSTAKINKIEVYAPCVFMTKTGIHLGSSKDEILNKYPKPKFWDESDYYRINTDKEVSIIGLLNFELMDNKVVKITLKDRRD